MHCEILRVFFYCISVSSSSSLASSGGNRSPPEESDSGVAGPRLQLWCVEKVMVAPYTLSETSATLSAYFRIFGGGGGFYIYV